MSNTITNETINNLVSTLCDTKIDVSLAHFADGSSEIGMFSSAREAEAFCASAFQYEVNACKEAGLKEPKTWDELDSTCDYIGERFIIDADDIDFSITCEEGREYRLETSKGVVYLFENADEFRTLLENERDYRNN
jgi:hypothetical protein